MSNLLTDNTMNEQVKVIYLAGKFHSNNLQNFPRTIDHLDDKIKFVLVDCSNLTFMDSSGLGTLVLSFKKLQGTERKMILCSVKDEVKLLLELTGMDRVFEIISSQEEFTQQFLGF